MSAFRGHAPGTREYRRLILGLFFAGVATFAQLYSPQAVLPFIAAEFDVDPSTAALTVSASTLGLALAVIPWSVVADRRGRVAAMTMGILGATALGILAPFLTDLPLLLSVRFLEGVGLGAVPAVALAYLSEEVDAAHTAAAAGSYIAGTSLGGLAGRIVAGPIADFGEWRVGVLTVALLCGVAALLFLWLTPRARGFVPHRHRTAAPASRLGARLMRNLRSPAQLALYAQGILLMGGFVALYDYLSFRLLAAPFLLPQWAVSLLFVAYLAGTVASPSAGRLATRHARLPVLLGSIAVMAGGIVLTLPPWLPAVLAGLLILTSGFFAAHAVASGWAPVIAAPEARAQASALYYLGYYGGSSLFGWLLGYAFPAGGWGSVAIVVTGMTITAALIARAGLRRPDRLGG